MSKLKALAITSALLLGLAVSLSEAGAAEAEGRPTAEIGYVAVNPDITLRRLVVRNSEPQAVVLLLHGFPETLYAWKDLALELGRDFEVHAFDWPGYGRSSRPPLNQFAYAPADYARVLKAYIDESGLDRSKLVIYATDIGALPALLLALEEPDVARMIIVGDFAPLDRPEHMWASLQALKAEPSASVVRAQMNLSRDEILANVFYRGLPNPYPVSADLKFDMAEGWGHGGLTTADAFYHYYAYFSRDQQVLESGLARLETPVRVVWGAEDILIRPAMGLEFAGKARAEFRLLPGVGHFPHLQAPRETLEEIRAAVRP